MKINIPAFLDTLPIMGEGLAIIIGVMLLLWGVIALLNVTTKPRKKKD